MDSMVFDTASVSGTFSSSTTLTFDSSRSAFTPTAWAWFQPKSSRAPT